MQPVVLIKPLPGVHIRDPRDAQVLPPAGRKVPLTRFWRARLAEGGVVIVTKQAGDTKPDNGTKGDKK